jgi:chromosome segregation ATPase
MGTVYSTDSEPSVIIKTFEDEIQTLKNTFVNLENDLLDFKLKNTIETENLLIDLELYKMKLSKHEEIQKELENSNDKVREYKEIIDELKEEISKYRKDENVKEDLDKIINDLKTEIESMKNSKINKSEVDYYMKKYMSVEEENNRLKKHIQVYQSLLENK